MRATVAPRRAVYDVHDELREVVRGVLADPTQREPVKLARVLAQLELYGLLVPPEIGGEGATLGSALIVLEELAAAGQAEGYLHDAVLAPMLLRHLVDDDTVRGVLEGIAAGTHHVAALVDGAADDRRMFDVVGTDSDAVVVGSAGPLDAATAWQYLVVLARDGLAHLLAFVPVAHPGVRLGTAVDPAGRPVARVVIDGAMLAGCPVVRVAADHLDDIATVVGLAATARLVGAARRSLELTLQHVRTRHQFGRPLAGFQAVQMRCADLSRDVDSSAGIHHRAVAAFEGGLPDRHRLASMAVAWAGDACVRATQTAHLLHGALGFTAEFELRQHSLTALNARLGASVAFHRERIGRLLLHNSSEWSIR